MTPVARLDGCYGQTKHHIAADLGKVSGIPRYHLTPTDHGNQDELVIKTDSCQYFGSHIESTGDEQRGGNGECAAYRQHGRHFALFGVALRLFRQRRHNTILLGRFVG